MASKKGWIKVWRKIVDNEFCEGSVAKLGFWIWCLTKAVTEEGDYPLGNTTVHLKPGQFIFGKRKAAKETGLSESTVYAYINQLTICGHVCRHVHNHHYTIIEVLKWGYYQGSEKSHGHDANHDHDQTLYTIKEDKNIYASLSNEREANKKTKESLEKADLEDYSNPMKLYQKLMSEGGIKDD